MLIDKPELVQCLLRLRHFLFTKRSTRTWQFTILSDLLLPYVCHQNDITFSS